MMNNKNQGRGRMPDGILPPLKSREEIRWEFVETCRALRNLLSRGPTNTGAVDDHIDRIMEQALQGMALCHAIGWREGRAV